MLFAREHETPYNKSPVIRAVSMILMVVTVFSVFIRILTRLSAVKKSNFFTSDEVMILTSMACLLCYTMHGSLTSVGCFNRSINNCLHSRSEWAWQI
jgi:Na+/proline symporter